MHVHRTGLGAAGSQGFTLRALANSSTKQDFVVSLYAELPKQEKSPAAAPSPIPAAGSPLGAQRLDHRGEEPPILGSDLCDVLRAAEVRILHRLGEGGASRTVTEGAGEMAAVTRRHGSSGPLCTGPSTRESCRKAPQSEPRTLGCPAPHNPPAPLALAGPQGPNAHAFVSLLSPLIGFVRLPYHKIKAPSVLLT